MFKLIPKDILIIIFSLLPEDERYKSFLINRECRALNYNFSKSNSLYYSSRSKFYKLVAISSNWKTENDLKKIRIQYKDMEEWYYKFYLLFSTKTKKKPFNEYFSSYIYLYNIKRPGLMKSMVKYGIN